MTHGIFTSTGNLIAWCDSREDAIAMMRNIVHDEPEAADEIAAIPVTETGRPCGAAIPGSAAQVVAIAT